MTVAWFIRRGEKQWGPFSTQKMKEMAGSGNLHPEDIVWRDGLSAWQPAVSIPDFFPQRPPQPPAPRAEERIAYVRGDRFRTPRYCVGCMARDPSGRTSVISERTAVVSGGGPDVLVAVGVGLMAGGLVGAAVGGLVAGGMDRSSIGKQTWTFEFPICRACRQREEESFFNRDGRLIECIPYGDDFVFVFANVEYADVFREVNGLRPPPRGFVMPTEATTAETAPDKPAPSPPEDSPFANLDGDTNAVIRTPRRNSGR